MGQDGMAWEYLHLPMQQSLDNDVSVLLNKMHNDLTVWHRARPFDGSPLPSPYS